MKAVTKRQTTLFVVCVDGIQNDREGGFDKLYPAYGTFSDLQSAKAYQKLSGEGGRKARMFKTTLEAMQEI